MLGLFSGSNLALEKSTTQSSLWLLSTNEMSGVSEKAVDGCAGTDFEENCCTHTAGEAQPWLAVDLLVNYRVQLVKVLNRGSFGVISQLQS